MKRQKKTSEICWIIFYFSDFETVPRPVPSLARFTDDPPPYPGKYSKTNVNYLPSYDSAIKMAPELQIGNIDDMMTSVLNENSDENSELTDDHSNHQVEGATGDRIQSLSQSSICHEMDYEAQTDDDDLEGYTSSHSKRVVGEETIIRGNETLINEDE